MHYSHVSRAPKIFFLVCRSCSRIRLFFVGLIPSLLLGWMETNDLILKAIQMGFHCFFKGLADELWSAAIEKVWACSAAVLQ